MTARPRYSAVPSSPSTTTPAIRSFSTIRLVTSVDLSTVVLSLYGCISCCRTRQNSKAEFFSGVYVRGTE